MEKCLIKGDFEQVESTVLSLIKPSSRQILILVSFFNWIKRTLQRCLEKKGVKARIELEGSLAKGTILNDKWEIDIFVIFEDKTREWIERKAEILLKSCMKTIMPYTIKYSQHPYITVQVAGLEADIVPIVDIEKIQGDIGVERTPLHTRFMKKNLTRKQQDEVRLLKSFLKGIGVYGAESHIRGFSGYLAEVLVYRYGSFRKVLEAASSWKPGTYIDPIGSSDQRFLREKYRDSVLIVVDPVDPTRNVAASVSIESLSKFVIASKLYLSRPNTSFFHVCGSKLARLLGSKTVPGTYLLRTTCVADLAKNPPETIWSKLAKIGRIAADVLLKNDIQVYSIFIETDEAKTLKLSLLLDRCKPKEHEIMRGPTAWVKTEYLIRFFEKRSKENSIITFSEDRILGIRQRKNPISPDRIVNIIRNEIRDACCEVTCIECDSIRGEECDPTPVWIKYTLEILGS
ncbi:MAG: CCA tRNA nucleotidyltransferase [Desulfurococcales archaeon]|nr:CCA tRNA nucleotidyltransferase [Desulfurococcales archaeon]